MASMQVLLSGYYGKGNGGDEALLATLLQMLPSSVKPIILSGNCQITQELYGVSSVERMQLTSIGKALTSCDALIWGGGSLIQDTTGYLNPFYYGMIMMTAQKMGLITIAWGQGIGPIKHRSTYWLAKRCFAGCSQVSVRDHNSAALLSEWRIPYTLAPDPVWALASKPIPELEKLHTPRIAIALRSHSLLTKARLDKLIQALVEFQQVTGSFIIVLPFQPSYDLMVAQVLDSALQNNSQIISMEDPQLLKGVFRYVDMVIGMRLHSLIMGISEGCRCFALSYDLKINMLIEELGIPGWDLAALPSDPKFICQTWVRYLTEGKSLSSKEVSSLAKRALIHQEILHTTLN